MSKKEKNNDDIYVAIYELVRSIPKGRVSSYGAIAAGVGLRSGARMVGYALKHCSHIKPKVPAHRVVNSNGLLTGKHMFSPPEKMQQLLEKEGVQVKDDKVVAFLRLLWEPLNEMDM